ncbi:hypothetical protein [Polaribacter sp. Hel_I_88]|uniref:hypothetical protein n=1 Tax=Polaribacter sp. Hel_I_88 TaxID=1250006 RepID=UPI00047E6621|nr:hypothetical protein [Polaribacter sp. Hel_I_88]
MKLKFKDRIKIYFLPNIIRGLTFFGFSYEYLGKLSFLTNSVLLDQSTKLSKITINKNNNPKNIYVLLMLSGSKFHLYVESLIALGLKSKGHNVVFVIDDNSLPIHELKKINNEENWDYLAERDFIFASRFLERMKLNFVKISSFLESKKDITYLNKYDSILEATLLKQYKVGVIDETLPNYKEKTELIKKSISITHFLAEEIAEIKPDIVIMSHGIYSTWGPLFNVLNEYDLPILVHGRGKKRHSQVFNWNKTGDSWDVSDEWEKVKNNDLTEKELKEINAYLESRISHKDDVFVYNFGKQTNKKETIKFLGLEDDKPIYTLFTNVLWDAASAQREIAFNNPVEWVIETIEWFNKHPEKQLIVKIHPAEVVIGTNMPFYDIIVKRVELNKNIRVIKPQEKVNSWSIYDISNLGIVHTTTAGMEMPLVNKPCIVVSKTHYRSKGFTIDVNSKEDYFKTLNSFNIDNYDLEKNKKEAIKYAYLLFIRYQVPFNFFFEEVSTDIKGFRHTDLNLYLLDKNYNKILESILNKKPIFNG